MNHKNLNEKWYGTTVVSVRRDSEVVIAADGQVTLGDTVMKANARKVRSLAGGKVIQALLEQQQTHFPFLKD